MVGAAVERADEIIEAATTTVVPADHFDSLLAALARGAPRQIPAILSAKLALDSTMHGRGLGAGLLVHALDTVLAAARRAGGRVVLVDAIDDEAREFYEHHDFQQLPRQPRRLVMKLSTAAKALGLPWP